MNCAECGAAIEETDHRGGCFLKCTRRGLRGVRGRVVSRYPEGCREAEKIAPPKWCEKTKGAEK